MILIQIFLNREIGTFISFVITLELKKVRSKDVKTRSDCFSVGTLHTFKSYSPMKLQSKCPFDYFPPTLSFTLILPCPLEIFFVLVEK